MKAENLKPCNKVGYLNPKTGKYMYSQVQEVNVPHPKTGKPAIRLSTKFAGLKNADHIFWDEIDDLNRWANENSKDFKTEKKLVKFI